MLAYEANASRGTKHEKRGGLIESEGKRGGVGDSGGDKELEEQYLDQW